MSENMTENMSENIVDTEDIPVTEDTLVSHNPILIKAREKAYKLLEQFNNDNSDDSMQYAATLDGFEIDSEELESDYVINYPYELVITNNNNECASFTISESDEDSKILKNFSINKCGDKSGTSIISNIIGFAKTNGYIQIQLENVSAIEMDVVSNKPDSDEYIQEKYNFPLTLIKILEIGNTWYSRFKFNNDTTLFYEKNIRKLINQPITAVLYNFGKLKPEKFHKTTTKKMSEFLLKINADIGLTLTTDMTISGSITNIMHYIKKHHSDSYGIGINGIKRSFLEYIIDFFHFLIDVVFSLIDHPNDRINYYDTVKKKYTYLVLKLPKKGGRKIVSKRNKKNKHRYSRKNK